MIEPTTPAGRVRAYLDEHAQRPRLADRIHCLDSSDGTEHVPLDVSDLRELLDDLWLEPVLRRELAETRAALNALRPSHETPAADEDHQGGNCADIVVSLVGRAMRAEVQRDAAVQHARSEEGRAGKLYAALADLTSGAMSRGDAWAVLRETDPIEPSAPVHCTAAQPCEQTRPRRLVDEFSECRCGHERGFHGEGAGGPCHECEPCEQFRLAEHDPAPYVYDRPPASAEPIESLIERSSLGTPEARAARAAEPGDKPAPDWQQVAVSCRGLAEAVADRQAQASVLGSLASAVLRELAPLSSQPAPADRSEAPSREQLGAIATFLFDLLDEIDTASDIAKGDDRLYRSLVHRAQKRRFEVAQTDGYTLQWLRVRDDEGGQE